MEVLNSSKYLKEIKRKKKESGAITFHRRLDLIKLFEHGLVLHIASHTAMSGLLQSILNFACTRPPPSLAWKCHPGWSQQPILIIFSQQGRGSSPLHHRNLHQHRGLISYHHLHRPRPHLRHPHPRRQTLQGPCHLPILRTEEPPR